jgi:tRNA pseudouridine13 synthase
VDPGRVGYAGRKDRHAVTRQWMSLPVAGDDWLADLDDVGLEVLEASRDPEHLRLGDLAGNRFSILVREVAPEALAAARGRLAGVLGRGLPNRFGGQRFGRAGDNAERARALITGAVAPVGRREGRFLLSALQSEVFNRVLERRPVAVDEVLPGDVVVEHDGGGLRWVADPRQVAAGLAAFAVSATGPLPGPKMRRPRGEPLALERAVLAELGLPGLEVDPIWARYNLPGGRRPVRVRVAEASLAAGETATTARLDCVLPAGAYATVLLAELFGEVTDAAAADPSGHDEG